MAATKESFGDKLDRLIRQYRIGILGTLIIHAFFMLGLVLFQVSMKENPLKNDEPLFDITQDLMEMPELLPQEDQSGSDLSDNSDLKNAAVNEADQNKSSDDYYNEFKEIVNQSKGGSQFQAQDYADKRWLIKDWSKEYEYQEENASEKENMQNENKTGNNKQSSNTYSGKTIISYFLNGRKATKLPIPSYQCMGSGEVVVDITVNQNGKVTSAVIKSFTTPTGETCLPDAASSAAMRTRFNIDLKASQSQKGTITYKFVAQ